MGTGTEFGHVPLGDAHTYWFGTERAPEGRSEPGGELEYLRSKYGAWADPIPALLAATHPDDVLRNDLYDRAEASAWSRGPVVIVGDAAHPMRPHLGQGGCQGLEDAAVLAHCVGQGSDLAAAFARYATFRKPRTRSLTRESRLIGQIGEHAAGLHRRGGDAGVVAPARGGVDQAPGVNRCPIGLRAAAGSVVSSADGAQRA